MDSPTNEEVQAEVYRISHEHGGTTAYMLQCMLNERKSTKELLDALGLIANCRDIGYARGIALRTLEQIK